jgi:PKHD-type hydroxylase
MVREGNPFWIWEQEIPEEYCDAVIKRADEESAQEAEVGNVSLNQGGVVNKQYRDTNIKWLGDKFEPISLLLFNYVLRANTSAQWFFDLNGIEPIQIGQYKDGGFYNTHQDAGFGTESVFGTTRKLSVVLMLSDNNAYEGGDLVLKLTDDFVVPNKRGTIIVFPSPTYHVVTPVTKGERYTAVSWVVGKPWS